MQLNHYNTNFTARTFPITLICDNVTNAPNIGSLFRIADAFGIEKLILCGENIQLGRKMAKTSRATEKVVQYEITDSALTVVESFKSKGHQILALEITETSTAIHSTKFSNKAPIALVIGDENFGVSDPILKLCDTIVHINMFGQNSSMNVVQATNIALYEITKQLQ
ncbi:TrmH family RNA methyltransferase [Algibacter amylolyticus]|uniref:TrmH family RNA methyltransferase n=1 Tax=Algibacter amylolyticus TaxID=1608400 RepID=A0A5M7B1X3_9FLAO|nr:TrmH family RNA methyltransferase [Algibacter amylolyticus]KAA5821181.1 TrmH family RNA methyltransferase [Algibacter amylolyticus]MBB5269828.1 tRNA G18 (ribose-2'-O)-methylase SpoU [Algibacter amylolyticus]TSJ72127.1 TrmH family RNA methyltransferase [Algibacter amylolyticus]